MKIDLHTHSTRSDGTMSPTQLLHHAIINGVDVLGLTDHDTIAGWEEATKALRGKLQLVLGAEISCLTPEGKSVHILALLFDGAYQPLQDALSTSRDDRIPRMKKIVELMALDGISITFDEVLTHKPEGATLGRPHLADALVAKGIVKSRDEAFAKYLNNSSKYYVSHISPTPEEAVKLIKNAGGVSVMAHPYSSLVSSSEASEPGENNSKTNLFLEYFRVLKAAGLNGVEVDHRDHNLEVRRLLRATADELDLVTTGSSDFHGSGKLNQIGENVTAPEHWVRLEALANARRVLTSN